MESLLNHATRTFIPFPLPPPNIATHKRPSQACMPPLHTPSPLFHAASSSSLLTSSFVLGLFGANQALAITYDEVLESPVAPPEQVFPSLNFDAGGEQVLPSFDFDGAGVVNSVVEFVSSNPLVLLGAAAAIGVPLLLSKLLETPKAWGFISARNAYKKLGEEDVQSQLLDIRAASDIKAEGSPDLRAYKKRAVQLPYSGEGEAYVNKALKKFKEPASTVLYILDRFDGNSAAVAELLAANGFKAAYAIKDGAEGPNGWQKNQLPWILPRKGFLFDVGSLKDAIDSTVNENPNLVPATLGVAAAAGVGLVVFSEAETALQLVGSAALVNLFIKKFLFAKDRKKTLAELQAFLDTKVAPKGLVDELTGIGKVLLPKYQEVPTQAPENGAVISEVSEPAPSEVTAETKYEPAEISAEIKETEKEVKSLNISTDLPESATPLSPYTQYPELKPPSSPTPSRP